MARAEKHRRGNYKSSLIEADQRPWVGIQKFEFSNFKPDEFLLHNSDIQKFW